jgi:hypothetical protein
MVLNEIGVRGRGQKPWQHGHILRHGVMQDFVEDDMVRVRPKLNGSLKKGAYQRGLGLITKACAHKIRFLPIIC